MTKPFDWEGGRRMTNADAGLTELEANVAHHDATARGQSCERCGIDTWQWLRAARTCLSCQLTSSARGFVEAFAVPHRKSLKTVSVRPPLPITTLPLEGRAASAAGSIRGSGCVPPAPACRASYINNYNCR
ncbi:hypothetical protein [Mycobacterium tuberculosis]|uniref:hypothetical protein n=1 Tax=Mycobacterium tuberculosis TaxID=1773 RepID=UPI00272D1AC4|nr:hypothetical protein [Mycobacterium tuberculosis]